MELKKIKCKNCDHFLENEVVYCSQCGAKNIEERLSVKQIITDTGSKIFGLDSTFIRTVKAMLVHPGEVMSDYVSGVRKRYLHPITFLTIAATVSIITFNFFSEDYVRISSSLNEFTVENDVKQQQKNYDKKIAGLSPAGIDSLGIEPFDAIAHRKESIEKVEKGQLWTLKYFNLITFLLIPVYSFVSFLVFWKPYNFAEHLCFNAYIQGITFYATTICFLLSLVIHPLIYFVAMIFSVFFYSYAFGKLYKLNFGQSILKLLKFVGILLSVAFLAFIAGYLSAHFYK